MATSRSQWQCSINWYKYALFRIQTIYCSWFGYVTHQIVKVDFFIAFLFVYTCINTTNWTVNACLGVPASSTQVYPVKIGCVLLCFPCLFGKELFYKQDKLVNNKQTDLLEQNFSETIIPVEKSCILLCYLSIISVVCWYIFYISIDHCSGLSHLK